MKISLKPKEAQLLRELLHAHVSGTLAHSATAGKGGNFHTVLVKLEKLAGPADGIAQGHGLRRVLPRLVLRTDRYPNHVNLYE